MQNKLCVPDWIGYILAALLVVLVIVIVVMAINLFSTTDCSFDRANGEQAGLEYTTHDGATLYFTEDARVYLLGYRNGLESSGRSECRDDHFDAFLSAPK